MSHPVVRAKFKVQSETRHAWGHQVEVVLRPVTDSSPENKAFWDATPNGELKMTITNPEAAHALELGKSYYLDFVPAES